MIKDKSVYFFYIVLGALFIVISIYFIKTNYSLGYYFHSSQKLLVHYDEKQLFKLKKRLKKELQNCKKQEKKEQIILLLGRLSFIQALNSENLLRTTYLEQSMKYFTSILDSQNEALKPRIYFWLGITYYQQGPFYYSQSIDFLIKSLKLGYPQKIKIIKILNYIYLKNKNYNSIISINKEFMNQDYYDSDIIYILGIAYKENDEKKKAIQIFSYITNIKEKKKNLDQKIYNELFNYYIAKEQYNTALKFIKKYRGLYPNSQLGKYMYGIVALKSGNFESVKIFEALINEHFTNGNVKDYYQKAKEKFSK